MPTTISLLLFTLMIFIPNASAQSWLPIPSALESYDTTVPPYIRTTVIHNNELYVAGNFAGIEGVQTHSLARWDGAQWRPVGSGLTGRNAPSNEILSMATYGGELYVGGTFDSVDFMPAKNVAKWTGAYWSAVDPSINIGNVRAMIVVDTELYVCGSSVVKLSGGRWVRVGPDSVATGGSSMAVLNGELYVGGFNRVMKWNGTEWSIVGTNPWPGHLYAPLTVYQNEVYAGIYSLYDSNFIARFHGSEWGVIIQPKLQTFYLAFAPVQGKLFAGGVGEAFDSTAGVIPANGLAAWNGSQWRSVATGIQARVISFASSAGVLYAAGGFNFDGDTNHYNVAKLALPTSVHDPVVDRPGRFSLEQNYPNPFNPSTQIHFSLPRADFVSLKIFSTLGEEIATLVSEGLPAGSYTRQWNPTNVASGVYFYRLHSGSFMETKRLLLIK